MQSCVPVINNARIQIYIGHIRWDPTLQAKTRVMSRTFTQDTSLYVQIGPNVMRGQDIHDLLMVGWQVLSFRDYCLKVPFRFE